MTAPTDLSTEALEALPCPFCEWPADLYLRNMADGRRVVVRCRNDDCAASQRAHPDYLDRFDGEKVGTQDYAAARRFAVERWNDRPARKARLAEAEAVAHTSSARMMAAEEARDEARLVAGAVQARADDLEARLAEAEARVEVAAEAAYKLGFMATAEGWNGEYPFEHDRRDPEDDAGYTSARDNHIQSLVHGPDGIICDRALKDGEG